jgi:hypothetical protein
MTALNALYFPATSVTTRQVSRELFFFDKIFHYLPAETENPDDPLAALGLCQGYPPVPFQEDLDRFRHLIRELKGNEAEFYSGQLSALTAEKPGNLDERSVRSLVQVLGGRPAETDNAKAAAREELWQARLLLRLGEILQQEENTLQQELAAISIKEKELFESLKGEPEIAFTLTELPQSPNSAPVRPEILVKAWARLFLADPQRDSHHILTSAQQDAVELLFEANEALSGKRPARLFRIPLPAAGAMEGNDFVTARTAFRQQAKETLAGFASLLAATTAGGGAADSLKDFTALAAAWTKTLAGNKELVQDEALARPGKNCPAAPHLEAYLCDAGLPRLLSHISRKGDALPPAPGGSRAVIAVISTRKSTCTG